MKFIVSPKHQLRQRGFPFFIKRAVDVTLAVIALVFTMPLMIVISLLLLIFQGRTILFMQQRPGRFEKNFTIFKFRTMRNTYDDQGNLLPDNQRITRIGRLLRNYSLDELPQLINILCGELSFVGNRPLLNDHLEYMTNEERRRCLVMPGMSSLDAVEGRYNLSWEKQIALELWYVDNWNFWLDIKIILKTIIILLKNKKGKASIGCEREDFIKSRQIFRGEHGK